MKHSYKRAVVAVLTAALALALAACGGGDPEEHTFELRVEGGALAQGASLLEVKKDDTVTITVSADEPISFHLHGYDIEKEAAPGEPATLAFTADATGSFPFTIHVVAGGNGAEGEHEGETSADAEGHGELFESGTLEKGDTFSFQVTHSLEGTTVPYHNHMNHEMIGSIVVSDGAGVSETAEIEIRADGSFHPAELTVRPETLVVWTNSSDTRQRPTSGHPPTASEEHEEAEGEHGHEEDEEVELGRLQVQPR
jgi:hypothetical protein